MDALFSLEGRHVHLLPLGLEHVDGLLQVAEEDRDTFGFTVVPRTRDEMIAWVTKAEHARAAGTQVPFATWSVADDRVVGSTRFYDLEWWEWAATYAGHPPARPGGTGSGPDVVSIGHTWLGRLAQRTPINSEAKVLMLDHAFAHWGSFRVRIQTDARNDRSRTAIARLGCRLDGVIRADMPGADGTVRDSAVFSMLAEEWPVHRQRLIQRNNA
jgi:N-acetyltransferase